MKENLTNLHNYDKQDLFDIVAILKKILKEKKLIIKTSISFFFIGCLVALLSPVVFTSQTSFVPQVSGDDMSIRNNNLGSLASLAGININPTVMTNDSYLSPLVYRNIIDSEEFSLGLLSEELINSNGEKFTIREYLLSNRSFFNFNPIGFIKKFTIGLFLNNETNEINSNLLKDYNFISDEDYNLLTNFRSKFSISLNEKEGFISVAATDEDAFISSQLVELITKSLQSKIIEVRTNKIKGRLKFSKEQYELKQDEFNSLVNKLAEFKDSNKNISTAVFLSELQKLESEYELQKSILISLASAYNNNKLKLNKDTPIFSVIDEVSVPNKRTKPKRSFLVLIYVLLGLILSIGFILSKDYVMNLIKEIKD